MKKFLLLFLLLPTIALADGLTVPPSVVGTAQVGQVPGTTTNDNAAAGKVGEFISNKATGVALTSGTNTNITSLSLSPGDWDCTGTVQFNPSSATLSNAVAGVNNTSAIPDTDYIQWLQTTFTVAGVVFLAAPTKRFSLSASTTVYLIGQISFSVGSVSANGTIRCRRER